MQSYPTIANQESWDANKRQQNGQLWSYYVNDVATYHTSSTPTPVDREAPKHVSRRDNSTNQYSSLCQRTFQTFHPQQSPTFTPQTMIPQPSTQPQQKANETKRSQPNNGQYMGNYFLQNPFFMQDMESSPTVSDIPSMRNAENTISLSRDQDLQTMFRHQPAQWDMTSARPMDSRSHRREVVEHPQWKRDTYETLNHQDAGPVYVDRLQSKLTR